MSDQSTGRQRFSIDCHVHLIGNGSTGSGCWIRTKGWNTVLARLMLRELGVPPKALFGDFDREYSLRLIELLEKSSLSHAVVLAHDLVYDEYGRVLEGVGSFYVPNDHLFAVAAQSKKILPAVSIHPARADAIDELERCAALGAVIMKCLPNCHNIDCRLPKYRPFWKKMADLRMPLLAHTGGELSVQVVSRALQDPRILKEPLECGVTVIAAHGGSASYPGDRSYFEILTKMFEHHPNLYADNSALNSPFRSSILSHCLEEPVASRIVHGSDLPIPISGIYPFLRGLVSIPEVLAAKKERNLIERDVMLKKAIGFAPETFSRLAEILRLQ